MDYVPLNFKLMAHPANWAIVTLMVMIAGTALGLIYHPVNNLQKKESE